MFQKQKTQLLEKQEEAMLRQQQCMEEQNIENMNHIMEMMKLQESNDTKVKCPNGIRRTMSRTEQTTKLE